MSTKRNNFIDVLSAISIFSVIILHSTLTVFDYRQELSWFVSLVLQTIFIWPFPILFMITGANLLNYRERYTTKVYAEKELNESLFL